MDRLPYLKYDYKTPILRDWLLLESAQGCTPVLRDGLGLCMDKSPPALPEPASLPGSIKSAQTTTPVKPVTPPEPSPPPKDSAVRFLEWMIERGEKKQAQAKALSQPELPLPKPFDLYDIPFAMKAQGLAVAALLAQKWLDGRAYSAFGSDTPGRATEQLYPKDMVDTSTVTLKWLLGHRQIRQKFEALLTHLTSDNALRFLRKNIVGYLDKAPARIHELNTLEHCQGDWQSLHAQFQFQLENVSMADTLTDKLGMSDVTAALANFAFYASVARAKVHTVSYNRYNTPTGTQHCQKSTVTLTHIYAYAKDSYSFHDEGKSSQYLGHWNKNGVIVLPAAVAASVGMKKVADELRNQNNQKSDYQYALAWLNSKRIELGNDELTYYPVDIGKSLSEKEVYYPVRNRDYRQWRQLKKRGGDFLIFSDAKLIKLDQPIVMDMPEVCK